MKKVLLSILTLCAGLSVQAQFDNGYFPERGYAMDYVSDAANVQNVYWWEQSKDTVVTVKVDSLKVPSTCITTRKPFVYNWTRTAGVSGDVASGFVSYTMNQTYGNYEPVGVGFGEHKILDISKDNAYLGFKFKNTSPYDIILQVGLQDSNKNIINSMVIMKSGVYSPELVAGNSYHEQIQFTLKAGGSVDTILNFNESRYPDYTPYYPLYAKGKCNISVNDDPALPNPTRVRNFNYKILYAVTFTVVGTIVPGGNKDGYKPAPINGATFQISKFRVGTMNTLGINDNDELYSTNVLSVYPNPVNSGILNLSSIALNIKVLDVLGNIMITSPSAKELNVSSLNKGVYTLQCSKGTSRFVVE
ncbi:MAG: T9SS type A sorting domain-containing protein [Opitutaceae bacterium]|nr:T9SS type A sorting domain-containing protein [Cytophagales bacterium]